MHPGQATSSGAVGSSITAYIPPKMVVAKSGHKQMSKILQSTIAWSLLVRKPGGGEEFVLVRGEVLNWLQLLERTTGECLCMADRLRSSTSSSLSSFQENLRISVLDGASSNQRAEAQILLDRGPEWSNIALACFLCSVSSPSGHKAITTTHPKIKSWVS